MNTEEEQKNSDTPETDAAVVTCYGECGIDESFGFTSVPIDVCRKLERERNDAKKELHKKYIELDKLFDEAERIRIERDKARKLLAVARSIHGTLPFPE